MGIFSDTRPKVFGVFSFRMNTSPRSVIIMPPASMDAGVLQISVAFDRVHPISGRTRTTSWAEGSIPATRAIRGAAVAVNFSTSGQPGGVPEWIIRVARPEKSAAVGQCAAIDRNAVLSGCLVTASSSPASKDSIFLAHSVKQNSQPAPDAEIAHARYGVEAGTWAWVSGVK